MESTSIYMREQYELIRESRKVLFDYCKTISAVDFLNENNSFGRGGSIRNLLTHIANTYEFWIVKIGMSKTIEFTTYDSIQNINHVIELFERIDLFILEFFDLTDTQDNRKVLFEINGIKSSSLPFKLFTHVVTHEFHHKGQVLSLSRHLGYTPVDTDIMR